MNTRSLTSLASVGIKPRHRIRPDARQISLPLDHDRGLFGGLVPPIPMPVKKPIVNCHAIEVARQRRPLIGQLAIVERSMDDALVDAARRRLTEMLDGSAVTI